MEGRKVLVLAVAVIWIASFIGVVAYQKAITPSRQKLQIQHPIIDTKGSPTIGNPLANIEIVIFEDFRCSHCAHFTETAFPKILKEYINTGKARYTLIPIAFLPDSKPIANAALLVWAIKPELFFPFAEALFSKSPTELLNENDLLQIAKNVGGIDLERLKTCIKTECHSNQLENNIEQIRRIFGNGFGTPALFVNGFAIPADFHTLSAKIDELTGKQP